MKLIDLPQEIQTICKVYLEGLETILGEKLYGVYMYGATVFEDAGKPSDIDCHVILHAVPTDQERERLFALHDDLAERFPPLGEEVDVYYILLKDAKADVPPDNYLRTGIRDASWALHCAHVRTGRYITLRGPEPREIFPAPTWEQQVEALNHELGFIEENFKYPDYCVLNLCRIVYSFVNRDVVVSKRFGGKWACAQFSQWAKLIESAMRSYEGEVTPEETGALKVNVKRFYEFAMDQIRQARKDESNHY